MSVTPHPPALVKTEPLRGIISLPGNCGVLFLSPETSDHQLPLFRKKSDGGGVRWGLAPLPHLCVTLGKSLPVWEPGFPHWGEGRLNAPRRTVGVSWDVRVPVKEVLTVTKCSVHARHCAKRFLYVPRLIYSSHCPGRGGLSFPQFAVLKREGCLPESHGVDGSTGI